MINGSFWVGAALGALVAVALLNPSLFDPELGWRLAFLIGALIGLVVFPMRMWIPESPRWLAIHGREAEGEAVVAAIEARFADAGVASAAGSRKRRDPAALAHPHAARAKCSTRCSTATGSAPSSG